MKSVYPSILPLYMSLLPRVPGPQAAFVLGLGILFYCFYFFCCSYVQLTFVLWGSKRCV